MVVIICTPANWNVQQLLKPVLQLTRYLKKGLSKKTDQNRFVILRFSKPTTIFCFIGFKTQQLTFITAWTSQTNDRHRLYTITYPLLKLSLQNLFQILLSWYWLYAFATSKCMKLDRPKLPYILSLKYLQFEHQGTIWISEKRNKDIISDKFVTRHF